MRRRVLVLLIAALAAGALTLEATAVTAGASVSGKSHHSVVAKNKKKKKKAKCDSAAIKTAFDYFLNGSKGYTAEQKEAYIQSMDTNADFKAQFEASNAANAASAATTSVQVNKIKCAKNGKSAVVKFDLVLNGEAAAGLAPPGGAVLDHGTWKVSAETVCNLQALGDSNVLASGPCVDIINGTTSG
jgi:hypothetical protein